MKTFFLPRLLLPLIVLSVLIPPGLAADPKPKVPSKREAREIEKALTLRFQSDSTFTKRQRGFFDQSSVVGKPIAVVIAERGPATRVMDDGLGGKNLRLRNRHGRPDGRICSRLHRHRWIRQRRGTP